MSQKSRSPQIFLLACLQKNNAMQKAFIVRLGSVETSRRLQKKNLRGENSVQGGIITGNLATRLPQNLHPQAKYFAHILFSSQYQVNVTTRLVDLVGQCWLKQNVMEKICQVLFIDLDYFVSWGLLVETKFNSTIMLA